MEHIPLFGRLCSKSFVTACRKVDSEKDKTNSRPRQQHLLPFVCWRIDPSITCKFNILCFLISMENSITPCKSFVTKSGIQPFGVLWKNKKAPWFKLTPKAPRHGLLSYTHVHDEGRFPRTKTTRVADAARLIEARFSPGDQECGVPWQHLWRKIGPEGVAIVLPVRSRARLNSKRPKLYLFFLTYI